jgi:hypothetical protein
MDKESATGLINAVIQSIKQNPGQFQFNLNIIGTNVVNSAPGIGLNVNATGGGAGSTTIGYQSKLNSPQIKISQKEADDKIKQQMSKLTANLEAILEEMNKTKPDKSKIRIIFSSLSEKWVPGLITSVVANILTQLSLL